MTPDVRFIDETYDCRELRSFLPHEQIARLEMLVRSPRNSVALVAGVSGRLCGWGVAHLEVRDDLDWLWDQDAIRSVSGVCACIEYLHVAEGYRRHGVGSALLSGIETELVRRGKSIALLHCAHENTIAQEFYAKTGWRLERKVSPAWANGRDFDIYVKDLG